MFIAVLSTIVKIRKQQINGQRRFAYMHTMEYYSVINNEILPFMTTETDPEVLC